MADFSWTTLLTPAARLFASMFGRRPKVKASVRYYPSKYTSEINDTKTAYLEIDNLGPPPTTIKDFSIIRWKGRINRLTGLHGVMIMTNIRLSDFERDVDLSNWKRIPCALKHGESFSMRLFDVRRYSEIAGEGVLSFEVEHTYGRLKGNVPPP